MYCNNFSLENRGHFGWGFSTTARQLSDCYSRVTFPSPKATIYLVSYEIQPLVVVDFCEHATMWSFSLFSQSDLKGSWWRKDFQIWPSNDYVDSNTLLLRIIFFKFSVKRGGKNLSSFYLEQGDVPLKFQTNPTCCHLDPGLCWQCLHYHNQLDLQ